MKKKRIGKKGAMELSMNTIVVVVIGITLLVLGLVFVRSIFTKLGILGVQTFAEAEKELKQIETGDSKINFLQSIEVKKGKSSNPVLKICNTDGTLSSPSIELSASGFPTSGLSVTVGGQVINADTTSPKTISSSSIGTINYQTCRPFPALVMATPSVIVDPTKQPFLTITVKSGTNVYDSIGTTITIT